jgi:hypothetical protein
MQSISDFVGRYQVCRVIRGPKLQKSLTASEVNYELSEHG